MYKSIKLMSLVALLYGGSSLAYADVTCTDAPDCAALGYTQTEAQCASKPAIKCPFDTSKYYCKQTPVIEGCTVGSFLYTDGSCSSTYTSGRTLVGIVFDPIKKLAFGPMVTAKESFLMYGGLQGEYCSPAKALVDCGTDGAENSKKLFTTFSPAGSIVAANFEGGFGGLCAGLVSSWNIRVDWCSNISFRDPTTVSSKVWYGNGHWYIPSYKELYTIYQNKDILVSAAKKAVASGFYLGSAQTFLSSTVNDVNHLLTYYFGETSGGSRGSSFCNLYRYGISDGLYNCSGSTIIPVINYGDTEALGEFTPLDGFIIGDTNSSVCLYGQDNSTKVGCATYPDPNVSYDTRTSIYYAADMISPKSKCGFTGYKWCDKCQNKLFRCCDYSETGCISDY